MAATQRKDNESRKVPRLHLIDSAVKHFIPAEYDDLLEARAEEAKIQARLYARQRKLAEKRAKARKGTLSPVVIQTGAGTDKAERIAARKAAKREAERLAEKAAETLAAAVLIKQKRQAKAKRDQSGDSKGFISPWSEARKLRANVKGRKKRKTSRRKTK